MVQAIAIGISTKPKGSTCQNFSIFCVFCLTLKTTGEKPGMKNYRLAERDCSQGVAVRFYNLQVGLKNWTTLRACAVAPTLLQ